SWLKADFAGLVRDGARDVLRAVSREGEGFLVVDVPFDETVWAGIRQRTGIGVLSVEGGVSKRPGRVDVEGSPEDESRIARPVESLQGGARFVSLADRPDWATAGSPLMPVAT